MNIAVVGSRSWDNATIIREKLNQIRAKYPNMRLISGGARGADTIAERWALKNKIGVSLFLPDWNTHGKAAGMMRNSDIVEGVDMLIAFWDGSSRGTKDSIDKARKKGIPVIVVMPDGTQEVY